MLAPRGRIGGWAISPYLRLPGTLLQGPTTAAARAQSDLMTRSGYDGEKLRSTQSGVSVGSTYQSVGHMVRISTSEKPLPSSCARNASRRHCFVHLIAAGVCIAPRATYAVPSTCA